MTTALGLSSVKELRELAEAVISQVLEGTAMDQNENATKLLQLLDERVPANIRAEVRRRCSPCSNTRGRAFSHEKSCSISELL